MSYIQCVLCVKMLPLLNEMKKLYSTMMRMEKVVVMGAMTTTAGTVALKVYTLLNENYVLYIGVIKVWQIFFTLHNTDIFG